MNATMARSNGHIKDFSEYTPQNRTINAERVSRRIRRAVKWYLFKRQMEQVALLVGFVAIGVIFWIGVYQVLKWIF